MANLRSTLRSMNRRHFVKTSAAFAATPILLPNVLRFGQDSDDTIRVGLVGCGGRGTGAASQSLYADSKVVLTAAADLFPDRMGSSLTNLRNQHGERVKVDEDHQFFGFDAYERLINSGVDVVILATPPCFRPAQLRAAVEKGVHIFCEKPMAVDAPGVRSVFESVEIARQKRLSIVSGFVWRYSDPERATFGQINNGLIGDIRAAYTTYNTGVLNKFPRKPEWSEMEFQLRNWQHFTWLGGDHIVEQACHSIDKMHWSLGGVLPTQCTAIGGRQARTGEESGNVYDHFSVTYEYASGARGFHMCRQIPNCTNDNSDYILGAKGIADINGWVPRHTVTGETDWRYRGERRNMYQTQHDELIASIRAGEPVNDGQFMTESTLLAIMGRMAAYTGRTITWEQALNSQEQLTPDEWELGDVHFPPVAIPGQTPFI